VARDCRAGAERHDRRRLCSLQYRGLNAYHRVKLIKRQGYGRATLALLRRRVLAS
jgi:hypothetical protein